LAGTQTVDYGFRHRKAMNDIAIYLAQGLEDGSLDYYLVFTNRHLIPLKEQVDAMLIADGRQELTVLIV